MKHDLDTETELHNMALTNLRMCRNYKNLQIIFRLTKQFRGTTATKKYTGPNLTFYDTEPALSSILVTRRHYLES